MAYRIKWESGGEEKSNACDSISELTCTIGLVYIFVICLGLLFVALKQREDLAPPPSQAHSPESALFHALLPFDTGR